ncbi:hypothetical protein [Streptomyces sp. NPDC018693]|uniref:hypothetical protein n=1 Tax=unclassified Streptomyces TaxID=2593676 RepID=UPI003787483F
MRAGHGTVACLSRESWDSFVISRKPSWREAEYELMGDREALYDTSKPWPPGFPAESGLVD